MTAPVLAVEAGQTHTRGMLGLSDEAAVREGYRTVMGRAQAAYPSAKIDGVLVQKMAPSRPSS